MFVKPGMRRDEPDKPLLVRHPNLRPLRAEGEEVPEITYWHRRVLHGDAVIASPEPVIEGAAP